MITRFKLFLRWIARQANKLGRRKGCDRAHHKVTFYDGNGERWPPLGGYKRH